MRLCRLPLRQALGVEPFPGPLPPFLSPQGSACGILTFPGTGCSLLFGAGEGGDLGEEDGNFLSESAPGAQSPLWEWAEVRVCYVSARHRREAEKDLWGCGCRLPAHWVKEREQGSQRERRRDGEREMERQPW